MRFLIFVFIRHPFNITSVSERLYMQQETADQFLEEMRCFGRKRSIYMQFNLHLALLEMSCKFQLYNLDHRPTISTSAFVTKSCQKASLEGQFRGAGSTVIAVVFRNPSSHRTRSLGNTATHCN